MKSFLLLVLLSGFLAGCGGPPMGDAPEGAGSRLASELPPNEARKTLAGIRSHGGAKGTALKSR